MEATKRKKEKKNNYSQLLTDPNEDKSLGQIRKKSRLYFFTMIDIKLIYVFFCFRYQVRDKRKKKE